jgi:hypothetical protein
MQISKMVTGSYGDQVLALATEQGEAAIQLPVQE